MDIVTSRNFSLCRCKKFLLESFPCRSRMFPDCKELESLIRRQAQMNEYSAWITNIVNQSIRKLSTQTPISPFESLQSMKNPGCDFVLVWTSVGTRLLREFTLLEAKTFGTFHLLYLMVSDLGAQLMEGFSLEERIKRLLTNVSTGEPPESKENDVIGYICDDRCPCRTGTRNDQSVGSPTERNTDTPHLQIFQSTPQSEASASDPQMFAGYPATGPRFTQPPLLNPEVTTLVSTHAPPIYCALPLNSPLAINTDFSSFGFHNQSCHAHTSSVGRGSFGVRNGSQTPGFETNWTAAEGSPYEHQSLLRPCQRYLDEESHSHYASPSTYYHQPQQYPIDYFGGAQGEGDGREEFMQTSHAAPDGNVFRIDTNVSIANPQPFPRNVIAMATATATLTAMDHMNPTDVNPSAMHLNQTGMQVEEPSYFGDSVSSPDSVANQMGSSFYISTTTGPCSPYEDRDLC